MPIYELLLAAYQLGDMIVFNATAGAATFRSRESAVAFAKLAPVWWTIQYFSPSRASNLSGGAI